VLAEHQGPKGDGTKDALAIQNQWFGGGAVRDVHLMAAQGPVTTSAATVRRPGVTVICVRTSEAADEFSISFVCH
jgi:hypothetical protein